MPPHEVIQEKKKAYGLGLGIVVNLSLHYLALTYLLNDFCCICVSPIKYFLVFIHPDFCKANLVASNHLRAFWEGMRAFAAKNMSNNRARHNLQLPTTLPHLIINDICLNLQYFGEKNCCFKFIFKISINTKYRGVLACYEVSMPVQFMLHKCKQWF